MAQNNNKRSLLPSLTKALLMASVSLPLVFGQALASSELNNKPREMSPGATPSKKMGKFGPQPKYTEKDYSVDDQLKIYGGKRKFESQRPLLELGRQFYTSGELSKEYHFLGRKNPVAPNLIVFGDLRTVVAYADKGKEEVGQWATRANIDVDLKLTSTEHIHAFFRPFDDGADVTRVEFFGPDDNDQGRAIFDMNFENFWFEGDLGSLLTGATDQYYSWDLPFTGGLVPMLFQNGVWMNDTFLGGAFAIPSKNNRFLDITNMDVTFFGAADEVSTDAMLNRAGVQSKHGVHLYGTAIHIERLGGYWEAGYGYVDGKDRLDAFDYHNATLAYSARFRNHLSYSLRWIGNFGQEPVGQRQTADGHIFLFESSLITHLPSTLVPYINGWVGIDRPQPLAKAAGAGGVLNNVGITMEDDGVTGFPTLDNTGRNTYGGAIGVQYLFNLDQQLVVEVAGLDTLEDDNEAGRPAKAEQMGFGIRYQLPLAKQVIWRMDGVYNIRNKDDDTAGIRTEIRVKF